jgi:hypothetical protein
VLGNGQDDPGLFLRAMDDNLGDQRYLPFEGAGSDSSWHLELPSANNEIDLSAVTDVVVHLYYTAADGGDAFKQAVQADNALNAPTASALVFSAQTDPTGWQSFLQPPGAVDQTLEFNVSAASFPNWTRGKMITVNALDVFAVSWPGGSFVVQPQAPLPAGNVMLNPVASTVEPKVAGGSVAVVNPPLGRWTFKLRTPAAADFRSITANDVGDVVLVVGFGVS